MLCDQNLNQNLNLRKILDKDYKMASRNKLIHLPYLGRVKPIKPPIPKEKKINLSANRPIKRRSISERQQAYKILIKENPKISKNAR